MKMYGNRLASLLFTRENDSFPQRWASIWLHFLNTINLTYFWSKLSPKAAVMTARLQMSKNGTNGQYQGLKSCLWWSRTSRTLIHLIPTIPHLLPSRFTVSPPFLGTFSNPSCLHFLYELSRFYHLSLCSYFGNIPKSLESLFFLPPKFLVIHKLARGAKIRPELLKAWMFSFLQILPQSWCGIHFSQCRNLHVSAHGTYTTCMFTFTVLLG